MYVCVCPLIVSLNLTCILVCRSVCRGYGALSIRVVGGPVPLRWDLPADLTLKHPAVVPSSLCTARALPGPDGHFIAGTLKYHLEPEQTVLPAGLCTLTASFDPVDKRRYCLTEVTAQVRVDRGSVQLVWVEPAPIREGRPLDDTVLSCVSRPPIPGTFRYSIDAAATADAASSHYGKTEAPSAPTAAPDGTVVTGQIFPRGFYHLMAEFVPEDRYVGGRADTYGDARACMCCAQHENTSTRILVRTGRVAWRRRACACCPLASPSCSGSSPRPSATRSRWLWATSSLRLWRTGPEEKSATSRRRALCCRQGRLGFAHCTLHLVA